MTVVDLRSDTVTLPTQAMREAMFHAELGDDVFGEDPTTLKLEQVMAERLGREAGLLVPSGTMGNLVSILTHCARGDEVILGDRCHSFLYEAGGIAALGGIHPHPIPNQSDGTLRLADIESAVRSDNVHFPRTRLICLENTQNQCGGRVLKPNYIADVARYAKMHQLRLHLDGARLFNAAVALNVEASAFTQHIDSLSVCLSKGLSAPIGSVICSTKEFIREARRTRKLVGGGMRQSGIIAAAGLVALDQMIDRLAEDHALAKKLALEIDQIEGLTLDPDMVETNILFFDLVDPGLTAPQLVEALNRRGVKLLAINAKRLRAVTHYGINASHIDTVAAVLRDTIRQ